MKNRIVNADVFSDFNQECGALSTSELRNSITQRTISADDYFLPGQGLTESDCADIAALARHNGFDAAFRFWQPFSSAPRAPRSLTHKHQPCNSMISTPKPQPDGSFRADLLISTGSELISDHVTGQHVQGMVLIEACRQMLIAVSELQYMEQKEGRLGYAIFNKMGVVFNSFTFPIPAVIEYRECSCTSPRPYRLNIEAQVNVVQNGKITTTMDFEYSLFDAQRLRKQEVAMGIKAVTAYTSCNAVSPVMSRTDTVE